MHNLTNVSGDPFVLRLRNFAAFSAGDEAELRSLTSEPVRTIEARRDLIREGDRPCGVKLILSGWASAYKMLADGRFQNLAFLLPGDMTDIHEVVLGKIDYSVRALTKVRYVELSYDHLHNIGREHPRLLQAMWWQSMTAIAVQREWTVSVGQRNALERLCHLFCELFLRLEAIGQTDGESCDMPVTQVDLAEATGLTPVHVNRMIQHMREVGLVTLEKRRLTIPDLARLQASALFSPNYLHLEQNGLAFCESIYAFSMASEG